MPQPPRRTGWRSLSTSMKSMIVTVSALALITAITIVVAMLNRPAPAEPDASGRLDTVAENSHYLDRAGDEAPTLVEFLDFECEACGALYPYIEQIREEYDGEINYVVRYFPLDGHFNSMHAALAVEAAAEQGAVEEMYRMMFETQAEWGEGNSSEAERFRGYAEELGLDLAAYDETVAYPATRARVEQDYNAGLALGVSSTPTFFLDGRPLELLGPDDLPNALDKALGRR